MKTSKHGKAPGVTPKARGEARGAGVPRPDGLMAAGAPYSDGAYEACRTRVAIRMGRFFVEHLVRLHREFDGDLEQVILLGEIGHHNASGLRYGADGSLVGRGADGVAPRMQPCNAFSASQATGIPRETVRRKLAKLTRRGWVSRNERGEYFVTPVAAAHFTPVFNRATMDGLLLAASDIEAMLREAATARTGADAKR
ncbi:MAG: hypothetical protein MUE42_06800 [Opitutaceae bacterium]|jgi:hypothetical protein|nr:hypothetical protein [Opitutaceae bacterium]